MTREDQLHMMAKQLYDQTIKDNDLTEIITRWRKQGKLHVDLDNTKLDNEMKKLSESELRIVLGKLMSFFRIAEKTIPKNKEKGDRWT